MVHYVPLNKILVKDFWICGRGSAEGRYAGPNTKLGISVVAVWHITDHDGQLVECLHLNGIVPPTARTPDEDGHEGGSLLSSALWLNCGASASKRHRRTPQGKTGL